MVTMMQGEGGAGSLRRDWGELAGNSKVEMIKIMIMVMIMIMHYHYADDHDHDGDDHYHDG